MVELTLQDGRFTKEGLKPLIRLGRLERLALVDSNVTDDIVEVLVGCEGLTAPHLRGTFVTDAVGPTLFRFPRMQRVAVRYIDVIADAAKSWESTSRPAMRNLFVIYEWNYDKPVLLGFRFRWARCHPQERRSGSRSVWLAKIRTPGCFSARIAAKRSKPGRSVA